MEIILLDGNNLGTLKQEGINVLYGAGRTAEAIIKRVAFTDGIHIDYVIDDDPKKWGGTILNTFQICSFDHFYEKVSSESGRINLIISTMYAELILQKISKAPELAGRIIYYDAIDFRKNDAQLIDNVKKDYQEKKTSWIKKLDNNKKIYSDKESRDVSDAIREYLDSDDRNYLREVCSGEEFYFIPEVLRALPANPIIVDGGAYTGDLYRQLDKLNITYDKWICFELDKINYETICKNVLSENTDSRIIVENMGLSDTTKNCFEYRDGICSHIVDYETDYSVKLVAIDNYFKLVSAYNN